MGLSVGAGSPGLAMVGVPGRTDAEEVSISRTVRTGALVAVGNGLSVLPLYALPTATATSLVWLLHLAALLTTMVFLLRSGRSGDRAVLPTPARGLWST